MDRSILHLLFAVSTLFAVVSGRETAPSGFLIAASYDPGAASNALYKIDPMTANFTLFTPLTGYKAYDLTYDFVHQSLYVFGALSSVKGASGSVMIINPFNGTQKYQEISVQEDAEIFGLRVDSSTGILYSLQLDDFSDNPTSIVQIDPRNFVAKRWVNITKADGVQPDSMAIFFNATAHQYFVTVPYGPDNALVGIDVVKRKIISKVALPNLPEYLCYDNTTDAFYGIQESEGSKRACRLIRMNPYNGTIEILSPDFKDYLSSAGTCYGGFYFAMIVEKLDKQNIVTFDLKNKGKVIANHPAQDYLDAFAFVPI